MTSEFGSLKQISSIFFDTKSSLSQQKLQLEKGGGGGGGGGGRELNH